jgi:hypothetical protein
MIIRLIISRQPLTPFSNPVVIVTSETKDVKTIGNAVKIVVFSQANKTMISCRF